MATAPRSFSVTYNGVTVGAAATRQITAERSPLVFFEDEQNGEFRLEFDYVVRATGESEYKTDIGTINTAFRTPYKDLTVTMGDGTSSSNLFEFTADGSSGRLYIDPVVVVSKPGSKHDTARSALFHFVLTAGLPQDQRTDNGSSGYRNGTVSVNTTPEGRRSVTIAGEYTAVGTADARTNLANRISARETAVLEAIGGSDSNWFLAEDVNADVDDTRDGVDAGRGSVVRFTRVYLEQMVAEPGADHAGLLSGATSLFNNRDLVNPTWKVERTTAAPLEELKLRRFVSATVTFETGVVFSRVSGLSGLKNLWENTILDFLVAEARTVLGTAATGISENSPEFDPVDNRIRATLVVNAASLGGLPISSTIQIQDTEKPGQLAIPVAVPNPNAKIEYQGPGEYIRRITITSTHFDIPRGRPLPNKRRMPKQAGRIVKMDEFSAEREALGERGDSLQLITTTQTIEFEYFNPVGANGEAPAAPVGEPLDAVEEFFGPDRPDVGLGAPDDGLGLGAPKPNRVGGVL